MAIMPADRSHDTADQTALLPERTNHNLIGRYDVRPSAARDDLPGHGHRLG
jgi:hypothetical protein